VATSTDEERFGTDVSTFVENEDGELDLDPNFALISGRRVVAESVARLWHCNPGSLITDPAAGFNLRMMLGSQIDSTPGALDGLRARLTTEAMRDARVAAIAISLALSTEGVLRVTSRITTDEGEEFDFVLGIDKVSVLFFEVSEAA
jgi:hypothetical protein